MFEILKTNLEIARKREAADVLGAYKKALAAAISVAPELVSLIRAEMEVYEMSNNDRVSSYV